MRKVLQFPASACAPSDADVLSTPGMSGGKASPATAALIKDAQSLFLAEAEPAAVRADLTVAEFAGIFPGEGLNAADAPLAEIFPRAKRLALFACTIGHKLTDHIRHLFEQHDYGLGYVLDAVASAGADNLAQAIEDGFRSELTAGGEKADGDALLRYSPGYCGWHVSGQRRLFAALKPEEAGITLRESFLMEPLKSVSGVLILGPNHIHRYEPGFGFCADCRNRTCRERQGMLGHDPNCRTQSGHVPDSQKE